MIVGVMLFRLQFPGVGSLKAKRRILLSLKDKLKNKFNLSVAELEDNDVWQSGTIGIAVIANDRIFANAVLSKASDLVNSRPDIIVNDIRLEWL
jgi:uncharacterized protein YlxP (DUF503 family)